MIKVVILDTGLDRNNQRFDGFYCDGASFSIKDNSIYKTQEFQDEVGHGTAISNIILNECKDVVVFPIKVIGNEYFTEESVIIEALKYIYDQIDCQIINMSLGLNICTKSAEMEDIINKLANKGVVIVSAFNNDGSMSYPAMFKNVIGVDSCYDSVAVDYYEYIENSEINIRAYGGNQRVLWLSNQYKVVCGSSFATAHITAKIATFLSQEKDYRLVHQNLKDSASKIVSSTKPRGLDVGFEINKAIVFPYNKEIHSLVRFDDLLSFVLTGVYDVRESGNVGKKLISESSKEYEIHNVFKINWNDDFDTIIVGHINVLEKKLGIDIKKYLLLKCRLHNKKMYSFDFLKDEHKGLLNQDELFFPYVNERMLPQNTFGKLYHIDKPVLGVFGTGSKQGKFTLQMKLRKKFAHNGYSVGHIGTEPSALLFGCDRVYPMGYENSVDLKGFDSVSLLNRYMFDVSRYSELIIVGSQANTVPPVMCNQCYFTTKQIEFLLGTQPDATILCINAHDDIDYISRTITFIESLVESKVIALVMFPLKLKEGWAGVNGVMERVSQDEKEFVKQYVMKKHKLPLFFLDDEEEIDKLYDICVSFFSE